MNPMLIRKLVTAIIATGAVTGVAQAQSNDALLNKLVQKGILSTQEAAELKKETKSIPGSAYLVDRRSHGRK